jgi:hypothetical protein
MREELTKERYFDIFVIIVLFFFGIYQSILYFGHQVVPNPDFFGFIRVGEELLSFELPSSYKRLPVLGVLQTGLSHLTGGQQAQLTAGWLLNAILHPFNIVLVWLVGRRIIGQSALWVAVIVAINPWILKYLTQPIAETTFLFFILVTFYFILRQSRLSYLFASIASMVRYEGAALILAAFVIDIIRCSSKEQRIRAFVYAGLAVIPLTMWISGTFLFWETEDNTHYFKVFARQGIGGISKKIAVYEYLSQIWQMGFYPLLSPLAAKEIGRFLLNLSKILIFASFTFGAVYGLSKRRWDILALLTFFLPYTLLHLTQAIWPRHCIATYWIFLIICFYGLQKVWRSTLNSGRVPKTIIAILQILLLGLASIYLIMLFFRLPEIIPISPRSTSVPFIAGMILAIFLVTRSFLYKARNLWPYLIASSLMFVMVVSNQFVLANVMGVGHKDMEFKLLAEWHRENARPGEKMVTSLPGTVRYFAPEHKESFIPLGSIRADRPANFVGQCNDMDITYVAWDSRTGLRPRSVYYKLWGYGNIAMLNKPQNTGPYEFITQIQVSEKRFINIFRLKNTNPMTQSEQK